MEEKNIKDRVPKYPGRYMITPVEGRPNIFDLARADEPTEPGTPLDKATLDGISKNRLTGRYYDLSASKVTVSSAGGAYNPMPTSWNATTEGGNSGGYSVTASGGINTIPRAFDGAANTYWSTSAKEPWIRLDIPEGITVTKMKIAMGQPDSWGTTTTLQGLTDSGSWVNLNTFSLPGSTNLIEYTLNNPSTYRAYRLNFSLYQSAEIRLYEWQISNWSSATYRYDFTLPANVAPSSWVKGQRVTVAVPNISPVSVVQNNINNIKINTILQPNRQYELVYNGATFDVKGV